MAIAKHDLTAPRGAKLRRWTVWCAGALGLGLGLVAGCGDDDDTQLVVDAAVDAATPAVDAAVDAAALAVDAATPAALDGWQIAVAAPAFTRRDPGNAAAGSTVSTSFTAQGTGMRAFGTCLVADIHGSKPCVSAADCATGALVPLATGHFEYCLAPPGETQTTCWTRNGADADWCNKVPPPGRVAGTYVTPSVDAAHLSGTGSRTRWAGLACLNAGTYPTFNDGPKPPCASSDPAAASYHLYVTSATSTFTAP